VTDNSRFKGSLFLPGDWYRLSFRKVMVKNIQVYGQYHEHWFRM